MLVTPRLKGKRESLALPGHVTQILHVSPLKEKVKTGAFVSMCWPLTTRRVMNLADRHSGDLGAFHHLTVKKVGRGSIPGFHPDANQLGLQRRGEDFVPGNCSELE